MIGICVGIESVFEPVFSHGNKSGFFSGSNSGISTSSPDGT